MTLFQDKKKEPPKEDASLSSAHRIEGTDGARGGASGNGQSPVVTYVS